MKLAMRLGSRPQQADNDRDPREGESAEIIDLASRTAYPAVTQRKGRSDALGLAAGVAVVALLGMATLWGLNSARNHQRPTAGARGAATATSSRAGPAASLSDRSAAGPGTRRCAAGRPGPGPGSGSRRPAPVEPRPGRQSLQLADHGVRFERPARAAQWSSRRGCREGQHRQRFCRPHRRRRRRSGAGARRRRSQDHRHARDDDPRDPRNRDQHRRARLRPGHRQPGCAQLRRKPGAGAALEPPDRPIPVGRCKAARSAPTSSGPG